MDNSEQPQTEIVQYRQISGVHLKTGIEEKAEDPRTSYEMSDEHVTNIQVEAGSVLVDFDNQEGVSIPFSNVVNLDYVVQEEEVPVQRSQPQGGRGNQRNRRGDRRRR